MVFSIPKKPLPRRTVLRGLCAGALVSVGLPRLSSMLNGNGDAYAQGAPLDKRFGVWFWGNGIIPPLWIPTATGSGAAWQLSPQLAPFEKVKQNLTVITGLEVKFKGEVHHVGPAGALSGHPHDAQLNYMAPTIDHVIAGLVGKGSAFKSLQVGVSRATANGVGHTVNYASSSGPGTPVAPEYNARTVFTRLFGQAPPAGMADRSAETRKRVLDVVAADANALKLKLGADDARRLEQHLDGIHQLEGRLQMLSGSDMGCGKEKLMPDTFPAAVDDLDGVVTPAQNEAMSDLMTYALACDLTKVFLFQHGRPAAHYNMSVLGIDNDIHDDVSHKELGNQPTMNRAMMYWFDQCRVFMEKLQSTPDGASNLLESSCIYATSDITFGFSHSQNEYPALLFGKAGGAIKGDTHVRVPGENISKLLFTLVNLYGGNVATFGAKEGAVTSGLPQILA